MPPMVARSGKGASKPRNWACSARARLRAARVMPASTTRVRSAALWLTMRFRAVASTIRSRRLMGFPRCSIEPPPRGATARALSFAAARTRVSSAAFRGRAMAVGATLSMASAVDATLSMAGARALWSAWYAGEGLVVVMGGARSTRRRRRGRLRRRMRFRCRTRRWGRFWRD